MAHIQLLHGPNLNLLGTRETNLYGNVTLAEINRRLIDLAQQWGHTLHCLQTNAEYELINAIQKAKDHNIEFFIINPAALTHTSIGIRDALLAVQIPFIEVHLSNIKAREDFRKESYLSDIATGVIFGLGPVGYESALYAANYFLLHSF